MTDFSLTPSELRATAEHLTDVSDRFKDVLSTLRDNLAAEGAPWGDDEPGRAFANGENGEV